MAQRFTYPQLLNGIPFDIWIVFTKHTYEIVLIESRYDIPSWTCATTMVVCPQFLSTLLMSIILFILEFNLYGTTVPREHFT